MNKKLIIIKLNQIFTERRVIGFCLFLLILAFSLPTVFAQTSGGGGSIKELTYTWEECNAMLDNKLKIYENATEKADKIFKTLIGILSILFLVSIGYILISTGMAIQQIKDKGFKKFWKEQWKRK